MTPIEILIRRSPCTIVTLVFICLLSGMAPLDVSAQMDANQVLELVRDSDRNGSVMHERMKEFSFNSKITFRMVDKHGKVKENVYESYPPLNLRQKGPDELSYILVIKENSPVKRAHIERERARAQKQLEKMRRERIKGHGAPASRPADASYYKFSTKISNLFGIAAKTVTLSPSSILQNCQFAAPFTEQVGGREAVSLEFRDCSSDGLPEEERFISNFAGKVWLDAGEKVLIRLEAWPQSAGTTDMTAAGDPTLIYEQVRVSDGQWLPSRVVIRRGANISFKFLLGVEALESQIEFSDYTR